MSKNGDVNNFSIGDKVWTFSSLRKPTCYKNEEIVEGVVTNIIFNEYGNVFLQITLEDGARIRRGGVYGYIKDFVFGDEQTAKEELRKRRIEEFENN